MNSIANLIYTFFCGVYLGTDGAGNKYYQSKKSYDSMGRKRRWVLYNGVVEPTKVSAEWYAWLHHQTDAIPLQNRKRYSWEKQSLPNLTGTKYAYYPEGHVLSSGKRKKSTGDYQVWQQE